MGEVKRDIRRYHCEFCGICRSKKYLITSHILSNHQDEMESRKAKANEGDKANDGPKMNTCEECGVSFKKPAHLKQHMQSHSLERPFVCHVDDCLSSYRRKDHLTRHLLQHKGVLFECPVDGCKMSFSFKGNMTRHVREIHDQCASPEDHHPKEYVCLEAGCGKVFKYASKLKTHEESHVKLEMSEALCLEPGCMKHFTNEKCLKEHRETCHQHIVCEICGSKQLKKNIKRHLASHEGHTSKRMKCEFEYCQCTFSSKSNLAQHIKAVHLEAKPFSCGIPGCGMKFAYKHVRDNHEKSGCHICTPGGDFEEADDQFRSRPRGGRKRKLPVFESIMRKRIRPPSHTDPVFNQGTEYLSWLLSGDSGNEL